MWKINGVSREKKQFHNTSTWFQNSKFWSSEFINLQFNKILQNLHLYITIYSSVALEVFSHTMFQNNPSLIHTFFHKLLGSCDIHIKTKEHTVKCTMSMYIDSLWLHFPGRWLWSMVIITSVKYELHACMSLTYWPTTNTRCPTQVKTSWYLVVPELHISLDA